MDIKAKFEIGEDIINRMTTIAMEKEKAPVRVSFALRGDNSRVIIKKGKLSFGVLLPFEISILADKVIIAIKAKYTYRFILSILQKMLKEKMEYVRNYDIIYVSFDKPEEMEFDGVLVSPGDRCLKINAELNVRDSWLKNLTDEKEEEVIDNE